MNAFAKLTRPIRNQQTTLQPLCLNHCATLKLVIKAINVTRNHKQLQTKSTSLDKEVFTKNPKEVFLDVSNESERASMYFALLFDCINGTKFFAVPSSFYIALYFLYTQTIGLLKIYNQT